MGRKSKYDPNTFPELAEGYAREGMIDTEIAQMLGVSFQTFYEYQNLYPEFREAVLRGKQPVNMQVEKALLKRALGFEVEEKHTTIRIGEKGERDIREVKTVKKHFPPETNAAFKWLVNRDPERWRDKHELNHSGNVTFVTTNYGDEEGECPP